MYGRSVCEILVSSVCHELKTVVQNTLQKQDSYRVPYFDIIAMYSPRVREKIFWTSFAEEEKYFIAGQIQRCHLMPSCFTLARE